MWPVETWNCHVSILPQKLKPCANGLTVASEGFARDRVRRGNAAFYVESMPILLIFRVLGSSHKREISRDCAVLQMAISLGTFCLWPTLQT